MKNQEILSKLAEIKKGRYINFTKVKDLGKGIVKESDMVIRLGVNYANMKINKDRETGSLPWGKWVEGLENLVVEHKGNYYLRITSTDPANPESGADVIATRYLMEGQEISKDQVIEMIGESKLSGNASPVYNVKFENIVSLGR
jgi:hypothetical protein